MLDLEEKCKRCGGSGRLSANPEFGLSGGKCPDPNENGRELLNFIRRHRDEIKRILEGG